MRAAITGKCDFSQNLELEVENEHRLVPCRQNQLYSTIGKERENGMRVQGDHSRPLFNQKFFFLTCKEL